MKNKNTATRSRKIVDELRTLPVFSLGFKIFRQKTEKKIVVKISKANILKSGLIYSDAVIAVSPTYAKEMLTKEYGCGLEKVLQKNKKKLFGILNGIDMEKFNPLKDPFIKYHYSSKDNIERLKNDLYNVHSIMYIVKCT